MTALPKRPRVISSEPATPTQAPKDKRVTVPKAKSVGARTKAQKEQDPEEDAE